MCMWWSSSCSILWQNIYRIKAKSMFHTELFFSAKKPICAPYFQLFNNLISEYVCVDFVLLFRSSTFPFFGDILERSVMLLIWQPRLKIAQRERNSTLCQVSRNIFATELSCEYDPTQKKIHLPFSCIGCSFSQIFLGVEFIFVHIILY